MPLCNHRSLYGWNAEMLLLIGWNIKQAEVKLVSPPEYNNIIGRNLLDCREVLIMWQHAKLGSLFRNFYHGCDAVFCENKTNHFFLLTSGRKLIERATKERENKGGTKTWKTLQRNDEILWCLNWFHELIRRSNILSAQTQNNTDSIISTFHKEQSLQLKEKRIKNTERILGQNTSCTVRGQPDRWDGTEKVLASTKFIISAGGFHTRIETLFYHLPSVHAIRDACELERTRQ